MNGPGYWGECPTHGVVKATLTYEEKKPVYLCCVIDCFKQVERPRYVHFSDVSTAPDANRHCDQRCVVGSRSCNCKCGGMCHGLGRCVCRN